MRKALLIVGLLCLACMGQDYEMTPELAEFCSMVSKDGMYQLKSADSVEEVAPGHLFISQEPVKTHLEQEKLQFRLKGKFSAIDAVQDSKSQDFASVAINVHSPSMHTIDGKQFPMEMDVIHTLVNGEEDRNTLAVVTLLFEPTKEQTPFFESFNPTQKNDFDVDLRQLLSKDMDVYFYQNHFTTPPCSQFVNYFVAKKPMPINEKYLDLFREHFKETPRRRRESFLELNMEDTTERLRVFSTKLSVQSGALDTFVPAPKYPVVFVQSQVTADEDVLEAPTRTLMNVYLQVHAEVHHDEGFQNINIDVEPNYDLQYDPAIVSLLQQEQYEIQPVQVQQVAVLSVQAEPEPQQSTNYEATNTPESYQTQAEQNPQYQQQEQQQPQEQQPQAAPVEQVEAQTPTYDQSQTSQLQQQEDQSPSYDQVQPMTTTDQVETQSTIPANDISQYDTAYQTAQQDLTTPIAEDYNYEQAHEVARQIQSQVPETQTQFTFDDQQETQQQQQQQEIAPQVQQENQVTPEEQPQEAAVPVPQNSYTGEPHYADEKEYEDQQAQEVETVEHTFDYNEAHQLEAAKPELQLAQAETSRMAVEPEWPTVNDNSVEKSVDQLANNDQAQQSVNTSPQAEFPALPTAQNTPQTPSESQNSKSEFPPLPTSENVAPGPQQDLGIAGINPGMKTEDAPVVNFNQKCITLFSRCHFQGDHIEACNNMGEVENFQHPIHSIFVPAGLSITIYEDQNFSGEKFTFTESQECLLTPVLFTQMAQRTPFLAAQKNLRTRS